MYLVLAGPRVSIRFDAEDVICVGMRSGRSLLVIKKIRLFPGSLAPLYMQDRQPYAPQKCDMGLTHLGRHADNLRMHRQCRPHHRAALAGKRRR